MFIGKRATQKFIIRRRMLGNYYSLDYIHQFHQDLDKKESDDEDEDDEKADTKEPATSTAILR